MVTAIARELAGFVWAEMTADMASPRRAGRRANRARPTIPACRVTAAAGPIPGCSMPATPGASSEGHQPAHCRPAVPTREHQSGGQPTPSDPACGHPLGPTLFDGWAWEDLLEWVHTTVSADQAVQIKQAGVTPAELGWHWEDGQRGNLQYRLARGYMTVNQVILEAIARRVRAT